MSVEIDAPIPPAVCLTPAGLIATADAATRAHAFFWRVLTAAATLSITGNATHAILHSSDHAVISAVVAVVPPITLLAAVHGVSILSQARTKARFTQFFATALTVCIALGAFRLSYSALSSLAVFAGVPSNEAWLLPLIIEGSMTQATVALLALTHSHGSRAHDPQALTYDEAEYPHPPSTYSEGATNITNAPVDTADMGTHIAKRPHGLHWTAIARAICDRDPARRRDQDQVATILARHYDDGWTPTQISREIQRSRSMVSRIISDAARLQAI